MSKMIKKASLYIKSDFNMKYNICKVIYTLNDDDTYIYEFIPNYQIIDLINKEDFYKGIPEIPLFLRKKQYEIINNTPLFMLDNTEGDNHLDYLISNEVFIKNLNIYFEDYKEKELIYFNDIKGKSNSFGMIKLLLDNITSNNDVFINGVFIDDNNRRDIYRILLSIYEKAYALNILKQKKGIEQGKKNKIYLGRKPKEYDEVMFKYLSNRMDHKKISAEEAAKKLNISIHKFYRLRRKEKEETKLK